MSNDEQITSHSRRNVLKSVPAAGATLAFGDLAIGQEFEAGEDDSVFLGEFSTGLDGWTTTGGNDLTRVDEDEIPVAVHVGTHALAVEVNGDAHPMIENKARVSQADFVEHPYLLTNVLGYAEETDSDMVFTFRLHHTATPTGGQGGRGGRSGGKNVLVEESDEQTVAQLDPSVLRWDLTDVDEEILETANRLEIVWYLEDHPPDGNHRGRERGDFEYRGLVAFDDIRLTDDVAGAEASASQDKRNSLHRSHGMLVERTFEERTEMVEHGTFIFADGTEVPYSFEVLSEGRFRYTIDGETFDLGGGDE